MEPTKDYGLPKFLRPGALANQPENTNTTSSTNFVMLLPKIPNSVYFCTSVSLPGMTCPELGYKFKGATYKVPGSEVSHGELTFTYLVDERLANYNELQQWFSSTLAFRSGDSAVSYRNWMSEQGQLIILSAKKNPKFRITFKGLFPSKLSGVTFNSADTEAANLVATCNMSFTYYDMETFNA